MRGPWQDYAVRRNGWFTIFRDEQIEDRNVQRAHDAVGYGGR
jgi:hypothetical protein